MRYDCPGTVTLLKSIAQCMRDKGGERKTERETEKGEEIRC